MVPHNPTLFGREFTNRAREGSRLVFLSPAIQEKEMLNLKLFTKRSKTARPTLQLSDPSAYYGRYVGDKDIKPVRDLMAKQASLRTTEDEMRLDEARRITIG